jgi:hypothetical protein
LGYLECGVARIFISHSSLDGESAQRMKTWLDEIRFDKSFLDFDDQTGIAPGDDWERRLYSELERSYSVRRIIDQHPFQVDDQRRSSRDRADLCHDIARHIRISQRLSEPAADERSCACNKGAGVASIFCARLIFRARLHGSRLQSARKWRSSTRTISLTFFPQSHLLLASFTFESLAKFPPRGSTGLSQEVRRKI